MLTSDNQVCRLIGPNGACPDVTRLSEIYCINKLSVTNCTDEIRLVETVCTICSCILKLIPGVLMEFSAIVFECALQIMSKSQVTLKLNMSCLYVE